MVGHFLHLTVPATLTIFGFGGFLLYNAASFSSPSQLAELIAGWVSVIASGDQTDRGLAGRK